MGPATEAAIVAFKKASGLQPRPNVVGPAKPLQPAQMLALWREFRWWSPDFEFKRRFLGRRSTFPALASTR
jgi:hypothetical protein